MSNDHRTIVINLLPQTPEAWFSIALACAALAIPHCVYRSVEAEQAAKGRTAVSAHDKP